MLKTWESICEDFIEATSYGYGDLEEGWHLKADLSKKPPTYMKFKDAPVQIQLEKPEFSEVPSLWDVLQNRRSKRNFIDKPITLNQLNLILWGTQGITADLGDYQVRTTPSAGALYPIETFMLINNVEGLEKGLYHLNVQDWILEGIKLGDFSDFAFDVTEQQEMTKKAAVNFVWTAVIDRTLFKYKERTYRYIWWDVGHVSQNFHLVANALKLGSCTMGHWYDKEMNKFLGIDGRKHLSVLMASVGQVEGKDWLHDRRPPKI
ncbi:SagB/ThcOx family dehydrogenase [Cytobacillus sp. FJAT-54145]|uniref:SagB/ThcOx family dehydrogenase n=2 Tax=Cytobacillus spartinae TaxID=3299023 RepID=A0ABW6KDH8_9BACI